MKLYIFVINDFLFILLFTYIYIYIYIISMNIKILNSYFIEKDTMLLHRLNKYTINKI